MMQYVGIIFFLLSGTSVNQYLCFPAQQSTQEHFILNWSLSVFSSLRFLVYDHEYWWNSGCSPPAKIKTQCTYIKMLSIHVYNTKLEHFKHMGIQFTYLAASICCVLWCKHSWHYFEVHLSLLRYNKPMLIFRVELLEWLVCGLSRYLMNCSPFCS